MRSANALESLLFVRSLAHTDVSVEATASSVSSPFGVRRACSGTLVAAPGFFLEPDLLQLDSHGSCERALLDWCSLGSHWPLHSVRLIERLLVQRVHCRLVSHFDNLLNSSLLSRRSSVIRHVDNLFSSSLLNTLRCVVVWSTNCCAAKLLLLPLLWGLCRLLHICIRIAYLRNFSVFVLGDCIGLGFGRFVAFTFGDVVILCLGTFRNRVALVAFLIRRFQHSSCRLRRLWLDRHGFFQQPCKSTFSSHVGALV